MVLMKCFGQSSGKIFDCRFEPITALTYKQIKTNCKNVWIVRYVFQIPSVMFQIVLMELFKK